MPTPVRAESHHFMWQKTIYSTFNHHVGVTYKLQQLCNADGRPSRKKSNMSMSCCVLQIISQ